MPRNRYVLAVDVGTTRTKGIIVNNRAKVVAQASLTHSDIVPYPGWHEQDAESVWWGEFVAIVRHLINMTEVRASDIKCICITGMFTCFCPTDEEGNPLCNALLYDDTRALEYARRLNHSQQSNLKGNEFLARLMWFRNAFPSLQSRLQRVFSTHSFIVYRLTGRYCIDAHTACGYGSIFDRETFSWRREELTQAEVAESLLPEVLPPLAIAGYVTSASAREAGLHIDTPVLAGAGDMFETLVSSGAHQQGDVLVHYGSGGAFSQLTRDILDVLGAQSYLGGNEGVRWLMVLPRSGKQIETYSHLFHRRQSTHDADLLEYLSASIDVSQPAGGQLLFFNDTGQPHEFIMASPMLATFLAVPLDATGPDFFRAMLEGFGYRIRQCAENAGVINSRLRWFAAGGGAKNAAWCQIVTDIVGHEQVICSYGDSAFGGALMAGHAINLFDLQEIIERCIQRARVYRPQAHLRHYYDNQYKKYQYICQFLQDYRERYIDIV